MLQPLHLLVCLPMILLAPLLGLAQQSVVATGGDANGSGGSVSYSIGQPAYTTISTPEASVAQGVQQPYEISVITGLEEDSPISLSAFPNPATDAVELVLGEGSTAGMNYLLHDVGGRLLSTGRLTSDRQRIELSGFSSGQYILAVQRDGITLRSFQIVKH